MSNNKPIPSVLKTKEGQFVSIRTDRSQTRLCSADRKCGNALVNIWKRERDSKNQMAFSFYYKNGHYFPEVDKDKLQLKMYETIPEVLSENHWFLKYNIGGGEHYGLQPVVAPQKYVCINNYSVLILDSNNCLLITDESTQTSVSSSSTPCFT